MHEKTAKKCQKNALREELTVGLPRAKTNISALQTRAETEQTNDKKMSEKTAEKCSKNLHKIVPKKPKNNTPCRPLVTTIECSQKQQQEIQQCAKPCHTNLRKNTPVHSLPRQLSNLPPRLLENLHTTVPKSHKTDQNMPPTRDDTQILEKKGTSPGSDGKAWVAATKSALGWRDSLPVSALRQRPLLDSPLCLIWGRRRSLRK